MTGESQIDPASSRGGPGMGELALQAAAIGGTAVWGLAEAARVGWLRVLLDLFPRSSWDAVTWVLIPAILLSGPAIQGVSVAVLTGRRRIPWGWGLAGSLGGTVGALAMLGAAVVAVERSLGLWAVGAVVGSVPAVLVLGFGPLVAAGWLVLLARALGSDAVGRAAIPLALGGVLVGWGLARDRLLNLTYVFDRPEALGFFVAVVVGGSLGAAWAACRGQRPPARTGPWE